MCGQGPRAPEARAYAVSRHSTHFFGTLHCSLLSCPIVFMQCGPVVTSARRQIQMPTEVARVHPNRVVTGGLKPSPRLYTLQINAIRGSKHLLRGPEVVEEDGALLRLLTPVLDNDARAVDDLAGVTLAVENACACCVSTIRRRFKSLDRQATYRDQPTRPAACRLGP